MNQCDLIENTSSKYIRENYILLEFRLIWSIYNWITIHGFIRLYLRKKGFETLTENVFIYIFEKIFINYYSKTNILFLPKAFKSKKTFRLIFSYFVA